MSEDGDERSLEGHTVVWTGSAGSGKSLFEDILRAGAKVLHLPLVETGPAPDENALERTLLASNRYGLIVFTSAAAVRAAASRLISPPAIAAVGPATAAELLASGHVPKIVPRAGNASSLADHVIDHRPRGPVLFVRGNRALRTLPDRLAEAGIEVEEVEAYTSSPVTEARAVEIMQSIRDTATAVVMGSPLGVETLARAVQPAPLSDLRQDILWISLGETTSLALVEAGVDSPFALDSPSPRSLFETIVRRGRRT